MPNSASSTRLVGKRRPRRVGSTIAINFLVAAPAIAQTGIDARGTAIAPVQNEASAKIIVDPPLAEALSKGVAVVQYRTENLRVAPVFGPAALSISPRVGHVHVSLDDARWVWAHASGEPVVLFGLTPGPHRVRIQLMTANHQRLDEGAVEFTVPEARTATQSQKAPHDPGVDQPRAALIIDSPLPEPLARGVVFLRYRTENLHLVPVFGPAAAAVSPRIGHILVTVDGAPWHWADASGNPVIIQGLASGRHTILIELATADHRVIDRGTLEVTIRPPNTPSQAH
jgi:hypothetical protein